MMNQRVAQKLSRHRREGTTYPNAGALAMLSTERQRFEMKVARHRASMLTIEAEQALEEATKPDPAKIETKTEEPKGPVSKRG